MRPDFCTCGHEDHQHVKRNERYECTVCTCNGWDWDMERTLATERKQRMAADGK